LRNHEELENMGRRPFVGLVNNAVHGCVNKDQGQGRE
jgi:hypothetical protein